MKSAKRGFRCTGVASTEGDESVLTLIRFSFGIFGRRFVNHRLADLVFFARPVTEIQQPTALAAKRKFWIRFGIRRLPANRTVPLHDIQNTPILALCGSDLIVAQDTPRTVILSASGEDERSKIPAVPERISALPFYFTSNAVASARAQDGE
jgi:hypothetical protein